VLLIAEFQMGSEGTSAAESRKPGCPW